MNACQAEPILFPGERVEEINGHLRLIERKAGLTFGTDAFLLAAFARAKQNTRAVDLGSGTGVIPLLLLDHDKARHVTAVEIQPAFADLISRNAAINGFSDRLTPLHADLRTLTPEALGGDVDLVLANPPYMTASSGRRNEAEEKYLARHEVNGGISDFCAAAGRLLRYGGKFDVVFRPDRLADLMRGLNDASMEAKRMTFVHADAFHEPCMVLVEAQKGAAPSLCVTKPLFLYTPAEPGCRQRVRTPEAEEIYRNCAFPD